MRHLVFEILEVFSKDELKEFRKFLLSPFFNTSERVIELYDALLKFWPEFKSPKLTHEYLHSKLKTKTEFNRLTINTLLSRLEKLAEKFFKQKAYDSVKDWEYIFVLDELCRRNPDKLYRRMLNRAEKENPSYKNSSGDYFLMKYFLERLKYNYSASLGIMPGKKLMNYELKSLQNTNKYLMCFSIPELIKGFNSEINFYDSYNLDLKLSFIYSFLKRKKFQKMLKTLVDNKVFGEYNFLFELFYALSLTLAEPKKIEYFYELKALVVKYSPELNPDDRTFFYGYLMDWCIGKKSRKSRDELTELYNIILQNGYYKNSIYKYIQVDVWRNILQHGVKTGRIEWLENIIEKYKNNLHPQNKKNMENYSYALLCFERNDFDKAQDYINKLKFDYFVFKLDAMNLYLKILYELNFENSTFSLMDTYTKDLADKNISKRKRTEHKNFLKFIKKLLHYKNKYKGYKKINLNSLRQSITSARAHSQKWLLDKLYELKRYKKAV